MKLGLKKLSSVMVVLMAASVCGCAAREYQFPKTATSLPANAKIVHCQDPRIDCFTPAEQACLKGQWMGVPEVGMAFPSIIQEGQHSYRMAIVCQ